MESQPTIEHLCKPPTIGGFLVKVAELWTRFPSRQEHCLSVPREWEDLVPLLTAISDFFSIQITFRFESPESSGCMSGESCGELPSYSFDPLRSLVFQRLDRQPRLPWKIASRSFISRKIGANLENLTLVHTKLADGKSPFHDAFVDSLLDPQLRFAEKSPILLVGSAASDRIANLPGVLSSASLGLSLGEELLLCSMCRAFVGTASGVATSAILSGTPYLVFKDPAEHATTVERDIGPGGKISWSKGRQSLVRSIPTPPLLSRLLSELYGGDRGESARKETFPD